MAMKMTPQSPPTGDFVFDSASNSPYVSCPSSPQRFGNHYFSAPTSPTRAAAFYRENFVEDPANVGTSLLNVPFSGEGKRDGSNFKNSRKIDNFDFEFQLVGQLEEPSISAADELFDGGKIRLLKPPMLEVQNDDDSTEIRNQVEKIKESDNLVIKETKQDNYDQPKKFKSSTSLERARSDLQNTKHNKSVVAWYNKLKLKDLLLFRSISEGHKEKYGMIRKRYKDDVKNSSFRSMESGGSVSSRRRVSAHEWHYTANRAAAEEMRKKTLLPYKRGLLGCLGFHAPVVHELSKGFGSYVLRES
ncbi:uncharacterized protein LOC141702323 [Apium graveolens]|uniref:uncharacterized protein LOC141702323 n=1 Tax=Apium graveolens TaxID=4045 RepID=UPI003D78E055